jgi:hypothetical protein
MHVSSAHKERVAVLEVETGLFVVRYASSRAAKAPSVFVRPSPSCEGDFQIISAPGCAKGVLSKPGEYVVIVAPGQGSLQVTVSTRALDGDLDASIRMEALATQDAEAPIVAEPAAPQRALTPSRPAARKAKELPVAYSGFAVMAHVARRGDLLVEPGEWIGGPAAPAPVEGLQINWTPPAGVTLDYQVLAVGAGGRWSAIVSAGEFAGSRGRRLPLAGVRLRLGGAHADRYSLRGEALFLGSAVESGSSRELQFVSRSGTDPLVGLRLELREATAAVREPAARFAPPIKTSEARRGGRVRVFRSGQSSRPDLLPSSTQVGERVLS